jgi:hypothetical protein
MIRLFGWRGRSQPSMRERAEAKLKTEAMLARSLHATQLGAAQPEEGIGAAGEGVLVGPV